MYLFCMPRRICLKIKYKNTVNDFLYSCSKFQSLFKTIFIGLVSVKILPIRINPVCFKFNKHEKFTTKDINRLSQSLTSSKIFKLIEISKIDIFQSHNYYRANSPRFHAQEDPIWNKTKYSECFWRFNFKNWKLNFLLWYLN